MKKLFYAFLFAATAILGGCNPIEEESKPLPEGFDNTSLEMNYCEVNARGNNNYVIYLETQTAGETSRRIVFNITAEEVSNGVPVGTFSVADGTVAEGTFTNILAGSYYLRLTDATVLTLIEDATLTIAQKEEGGYTFEAKIAGNYNLMEEVEEDQEQKKFVNVDCKYEGAPVLSGLTNGQYTEFDSYVCVVSYDEFKSGNKTYAQWDFMNLSLNYYYYMATGKLYNNDLATYPIGAATYTIITVADAERGERILPQGTFPFDAYNFGALNTALEAEVEYIDPVTGEEYADNVYDGSVAIKALGGGQYSITTTAFCQHGAFKTTAEQVLLIDYTQVELSIPEGAIFLDWQENTAGNRWVMTTIDPNNELLVEMHIYGKNATADGLASGVYKVSNSTNLESLDAGYEGVILMGDVDASGYNITGSNIYNYDGEIVALIQEGEVTITNNNAGGYAVEFNFEDQDDVYYYGGGSSSSVTISYPSEYNVTQAQAMFVGAGGWFIDLTDTTKSGGLTLRVLIIDDEDITFADGLPIGRYRFDSNAAPGTVLAGYMDNSGAYYSMLISADGKSLYALLVDGTVSISANGSDYTVEIDCSDESGNIHRGSYTGAIQLVNMYDEEATAAPMKAQSVTEWSNFNKKAISLGAHLNKENALKTYARKAELK